MKQSEWERSASYRLAISLTLLTIIHLSPSHPSSLLSSLPHSLVALYSFLYPIIFSLSLPFNQPHSPHTAIPSLTYLSRVLPLLKPLASPH